MNKEMSRLRIEKHDAALDKTKLAIIKGGVP